MKLYKKIISCFLICVMVSSLCFSGCSKNKEKENNAENKNTASDIANKEFDNYMKELFINEMSDNSVSTHFSLEKPETYGISFEEATWGEPLSLDSIDEIYKEQEDILEKLKTFDRDNLSNSQQITYDTLKSYLENSYAAKDYYLFDEIFSPMGGIQSQIPIIFSEYDFFDAGDIEDYIHLMDTVDDYINGYLEYEKNRADKGYFLTDTSADTVIEQCNDFIAPDENCLISIFSDKLDDFGIQATEKETYMKRFETAIDENLIPAYQNIISTLEELKGSRSTKLGLSEFDNGKEYYQLLVRNYTGSDKTVEEMINFVEESMANSISMAYILLEKDPDLYDEYLEFEYPLTDPEATIEMQIKNAKKYFPEVGEIPYEVKDVPKSLESTMNPAFYLVPPIDNKNKNMIYINHSEEYKEMNLFTTLAHEGVPGHMYQCYYFSNTNPDPIRTVMSFGGYTEGWATYVESYAYKIAGMSSSMANLAYSYEQYNFSIYCRVDLGIHYEGWDVDDINEFLGIYGIYDDTLAIQLYDLLIDDPAVYLQYYVGALEFFELYEKAQKEVNDFDLIEFHKFLLEIGPTYFDIISDEMDEWIDSQNSI